MKFYQIVLVCLGEGGLMTHMIPRVMRAVEPWLREHVTDPRFWDGEFDTTHAGEFDLPTPSEEDRKVMFDRFAAMPNPLFGKEIIAVVAAQQPEGSTHA